MKKKIMFSILTMALSITAFVGCGNSNAPAGNSSSPTPAPVTNSGSTPAPVNTDNSDIRLEVFQFKVEFAEAFDRLAHAYTEETGVDVNITTVGGGSDYGAALRANFASGIGPAIFNVGGPDDVASFRDKVTDLSDTESARIAAEGTLGPVSEGNSVFGLPMNLEGYGLIYNKAIFEQAGIDPMSITNYAQLEAAVIELDSQKADLGIQAVFAFPVMETWVTGLHTLNPVIAGEFGDIISTFEASNLEFVHEGAFKKIVDLQNDYSVQPTVTLDYSQQVERLFSLGQVAMIQQGNWAYSSIEDINADFAQNGIGMIPLQYEGISENTIPVGVPNYWAVNADLDAATQQAAKDFIDWMNTSETGKSYVLDEFKFIPAYEGYDLNRIADPLSQAVYSYASEGRSTNWVFMGFPTDWGMGVVGETLQAYVTDNMSWEDFIQNAKDRWNASRQR